jgi:hypothetical protein
VRRLIALLVVVGCKYPDPGFNTPADDQPGEDSGMDVGDGAPDDMAPPPCLEPLRLDNNVILPGKLVAGFSPSDDESFAISWLAANTLGYTEAPLGATYSQTNLPNQVLHASLSPDGNVLYFLDYNASGGVRTKRVTKNGDNATWTTAVWSGLADAFPGRPTKDDQRMFLIHDVQPEEWARMAGTWMSVRQYLAADFGNNATSNITSGNLSPNGEYLLYSLDNNGGEGGIYLRVRANDSFAVADGSSGRGLMTGPYKDPILTANCTHVYAYNTSTQQEERWDVHTSDPP